MKPEPLLDGWITSATLGLALDAALKVRSDIEEHYQAAIASGATPEQALASLGDPHQANAKYRGVFLTQSQDQFVRAMRAVKEPSGAFSPQRVRRGKQITYVLLAEAVLAMLFITWKQNAWAFMIVALLTINAMYKLLPTGTPSRARTLRSVKWAVLLAGAALAAWFGVKPWWSGFTALVLIAAMDLWRSNLRRKLPVQQWPDQLHR